MQPPGRLGPYIWAVWRPIGAAVVAMGVLAVTSATFAYLTGPAIALLFGPPGAASAHAPWAQRIGWQDVLHPSAAQLPVLLLLNAIVKGVAQATQFFYMGRASVRVEMALRADAFAHVVRGTPRFFARHHTGDLLSRLSSDARTVEQAVFYGVGSLVRDGLSLLVLLGFCAATQPKLTLWTLALGPVAALALRRFGRFYKRILARGQAQHGALISHLHEVLGGIQEVQQCQRERHEQARLQTLDAQLSDTAKRSYRLRAVRTPAMEILATLALALLLGAYVQATAGTQTPARAAGYVSFAAAILLMYEPLKKLGQVADHLTAGQVAAQRLFALMDPKPAVREHQNAFVLLHSRGRLCFDDVHFAYGHAQVLRGVEFRLAPGETLAVRGQSGAGKTTLVRLLLRFFDPDAGRIWLDGHDLRHLTVASLRAQIGVVAQEPYIFSGSAADNIAYGHSDASRRDIEAAADAAQALSFLRALPDGLDTPLGERGLSLSGGQKQRVAIARAILRDAPLLVLDEATSQLDQDNESAVDQALTTLSRGRTTLVISHRPSTLSRADRVVTLSEGRMVAEAAARASVLTRGARRERGPHHERRPR